jgi:hypothetical protein
VLGTAELATARARAQVAADAAALAAVSAGPLTGGDGNGCREADVAAAANGARLTRCEGPGGSWSPSAEVTVEVSGWGLLGAPVTAAAAAILEPAPEAGSVP